MRDYPFTILDVAGILNLKVRRRQPTNMDVDCPFCGHKKGKMNLNFAKNVFRCNYCGESGGMIELYSKVFQISNAQAFAEICEILHDNKKADALPKPIYTPDMEQIPKADSETRHQTYSMLLSQLILSKDHQKNLMERGLDAEQIVKYGYKSTPAFGFHKIVSAIMARECVLEGVPGFYTKKNNTYGINFNKHASGILIPIRSMDRRIEGFQIRLDRPIEDKKYIWFSSSNQFRGTSVGGPVHFIGNPADKTVYVTEGALKGTIAHYLSGDTFICVAGVNQYRNLKPVLEMLKSRHLQHLYEAYDMDKKMKVYCDGDSEKCDACQRKSATFYCPHKMQKRQILQNACRKVYEICSGLSISMSRMVWDMDPYGEWNGQIKGIDDYYYVLKNTG